MIVTQGKSIDQEDHQRLIRESCPWVLGVTEWHIGASWPLSFVDGVSPKQITDRSIVDGVFHGSKLQVDLLLM